MPALSRTAVRRVLWATAMLFLPLPTLALAPGAVPVARYVFLAAIVGVYAIGVGGTGVTWTIFALLVGHAVLYAVLLTLVARAVTRLLPDPLPIGAVTFGLAVLVVLALVVPLYHTPFDDAVAHTTWLGLFQ